MTIAAATSWCPHLFSVRRPRNRRTVSAPSPFIGFDIHQISSGGCVKAMDKTWHNTCFTCWSCGTKFTAESGFHEHKGNPHCEKCYVDAACPKCKGCAKAITDKSVNAMGGSWHIDCFVCKDCKKTFEGAANFYSVEDQPCCGPCAGVVAE